MSVRPLVSRKKKKPKVASEKQRIEVTKKKTGSRSLGNRALMVVIKKTIGICPTACTNMMIIRVALLLTSVR